MPITCQRFSAAEIVRKAQRANVDRGMAGQARICLGGREAGAVNLDRLGGGGLLDDIQRVADRLGREAE